MRPSQPVTYTRAEAIALIEGKVKRGLIKAGTYCEYKDGRKGSKRCAIGWLFSREEAKRIQYGGGEYPFADDMVQRGYIVISDMDPNIAAIWLRRVQTAVDSLADKERILEVLHGS